MSDQRGDNEILMKTNGFETTTSQHAKSFERSSAPPINNGLDFSAVICFLFMAENRCCFCTATPDQVKIRGCKVSALLLVTDGNGLVATLSSLWSVLFATLATITETQYVWTTSE